jgi:hypothetical protein
MRDARSPARRFVLPLAGALPILLVTLSACAAPSQGDPALRLMERDLEHRYFNRYVRVVRRSHAAADTLLIRFGGGWDLLRGGPDREYEVDALAEAVARRAAEAAGTIVGPCTVVTVEFTRSRYFGPLVWGAGGKQASFPVASLLPPAKAGAAHCVTPATA